MGKSLVWRTEIFYEKELERVKPSTVKHYHALIHGALNYAVDKHLIMWMWDLTWTRWILRRLRGAKGPGDRCPARTEAERRQATYEKIKKYVAEYNDGMKVSNLYIAQVKRKCGIELAENFNILRSEGAKQPQCPKEKEEAIIGALKAFQMI